MVGGEKDASKGGRDAYDYASIRRVGSSSGKDIVIVEGRSSRRDASDVEKAASGTFRQGVVVSHLEKEDHRSASREKCGRRKKKHMKEIFLSKKNEGCLEGIGDKAEKLESTMVEDASDSIEDRIATLRSWLIHCGGKEEAAEAQKKMRRSTSHRRSRSRKREKEIKGEQRERSRSASRREKQPKAPAFHPLTVKSFLDGSVFSSVSSMCAYNTAIARELSDNHLALIRLSVFHHDEKLFAELLYGDFLAEELEKIRDDASHYQTSTVECEMQRKRAVEKFNTKCDSARTSLLMFGGDINDAIQVLSAAAKKSLR